MALFVEGKTYHKRPRMGKHWIHYSFWPDQSRCGGTRRTKDVLRWKPWIEYGEKNWWCNSPLYVSCLRWRFTNNKTKHSPHPICYGILRLQPGMDVGWGVGLPNVSQRMKDKTVWGEKFTRDTTLTNLWVIRSTLPYHGWGIRGYVSIYEYMISK